jgi:hypothetical protein
MLSSGMLRRVALVRIDFSEEFSASFIREEERPFLREPHCVTSQKTPFFKRMLVVPKCSLFGIYTGSWSHKLSFVAKGGCQILNSALRYKLECPWLDSR